MTTGAFSSSRARRFLAAFIAVTVGSQLIGTVLAVVGRGTPLAAMANWVAVLGLGVTQWMVLRRHVPWAQWWALATIAGQGALYSVLFNFLFRQGDGAFGWGLQVGFVFAAIGAQLVAGLLLYPTLRGRVPSAWLWLAAVPAGAALGESIAGWVVPVGPRISPSSFALIARTILRVAPMAIAGALTLVWMCREWIEQPAVPPPSRAYSRVEFLIAWCAVPMTAWALLVVLNSSIGRVDTFRLALVAVPVVFVSVIAAGELWVLSGTGVHFDRWRWVTIYGIMATGFLALAPGVPAYFAYLLIQLTMAGGVVIPLGLAQWFAINRHSTGVVWVAATLAGWTCGYWIPQLVHEFVGPANSYRYAAIADPSMLGLVAGLLTGVALLPELNSPVVATATIREPEKP